MKPEPPEPLLRQLVEKLTKAHGDNLVSVILYGSAAGPGDHDPGFSDLNVLCVLREITPRQLERSQPVFSWWRAHEKPVPLLLSQREVQTSTDCFPIEFRDMQRRRKVLAGSDVIEGLVVPETFYRAQVEYELRSKLLRLRQKAATILDDRGLLARLLVESVTTFCVLIRHALLLHGSDAPHDRRAVVSLAAQRLGVSPESFSKLLDVREKKQKLGGLEPVALLGDYMKQIEIIIDMVDGLARQLPAV